MTIRCGLHYIDLWLDAIPGIHGASPSVWEVRAAFSISSHSTLSNSSLKKKKEKKELASRSYSAFWSLQLSFCLLHVRYQRICMSNNAFSFREHSSREFLQHFVCVCVCGCVHVLICTEYMHWLYLLEKVGEKNYTKTQSGCASLITVYLGTMKLWIIGYDWKWYKTPSVSDKKGKKRIGCNKAYCNEREMQVRTTSAREQRVFAVNISCICSAGTKSSS